MFYFQHFTIQITSKKSKNKHKEIHIKESLSERLHLLSTNMRSDFLIFPENGPICASFIYMHPCIRITFEVQKFSAIIQLSPCFNWLRPLIQPSTDQSCHQIIDPLLSILTNSPQFGEHVGPGFPVEAPLKAVGEIQLNTVFISCSGCSYLQEFIL